jgi:hypothetical protein
MTRRWSCRTFSIVGIAVARSGSCGQTIRRDQRVLEDLRASFEPVIDEVFVDNYGEVVEAARRRIAPGGYAD